MSVATFSIIVAIVTLLVVARPDSFKGLHVAEGCNVLQPRRATVCTQVIIWAVPDTLSQIACTVAHT